MRVVSFRTRKLLPRPQIDWIGRLTDAGFDPDDRVRLEALDAPHVDGVAPEALEEILAQKGAAALGLAVMRAAGCGQAEAAAIMSKLAEKRLIARGRDDGRWRTVGMGEGLRPGLRPRGRYGARFGVRSGAGSDAGAGLSRTAVLSRLADLQEALDRRPEVSPARAVGFAVSGAFLLGPEIRCGVLWCAPVVGEDAAAPNDDDARAIAGETAASLGSVWRLWPRDGAHPFNNAPHLVIRPRRASILVRPARPSGRSNGAQTGISTGVLGPWTGEFGALPVATSASSVAGFNDRGFLADDVGVPARAYDFSERDLLGLRPDSRPDGLQLSFLAARDLFAAQSGDVSQRAFSPITAAADLLRDAQMMGSRVVSMSPVIGFCATGPQFDLAFTLDDGAVLRCGFAVRARREMIFSVSALPDGMDAFGKIMISALDYALMRAALCLLSRPIRDAAAPLGAREVARGVRVWISGWPVFAAAPVECFGDAAKTAPSTGGQGSGVSSPSQPDMTASQPPSSLFPPLGDKVAGIFRVLIDRAAEGVGGSAGGGAGEGSIVFAVRAAGGVDMVADGLDSVSSHVRLRLVAAVRAALGGDVISDRVTHYANSGDAVGTFGVAIGVERFA